MAKKKDSYRNYALISSLNDNLIQIVMGDKKRLCAVANAKYQDGRQNCLLLTAPSYFIFDKILCGNRKVRSLLAVGDFVDWNEIRGDDIIDDFIEFDQYKLWSNYFVPIKQDNGDYLIIRHTYFERLGDEILSNFIFNTDKLDKLQDDEKTEYLASQIKNRDHDHYFPTSELTIGQVPFRLNVNKRKYQKPIKKTCIFRSQMKDDHEVIHHNGIL